jgi:5-methylcytosine-specific restriction protein A
MVTFQLLLHPTSSLLKTVTNPLSLDKIESSTDLEFELSTLSIISKVYSQTRAGDLAVFHDGNLIIGIAEILKCNAQENLLHVSKVSFYAKNKQVPLSAISEFVTRIARTKPSLVDLSSANVTAEEFVRFLDRVPPYVSVGEITKSRPIKIKPPILGEKFADRKEIWRLFGGQWQQGIMKFPDEKIVNVFSDASGPYPDFIDPETGVIEYRGQGLTGEQTLSHGNKMLEEARLQNQPIRFWKKPRRGVWQFETWALITDRTQILEKDSTGDQSKRILWFLVPVQSPDEVDWEIQAQQIEVLQLPEVNLDLPTDEIDPVRNYWEVSRKYESEASGNSGTTTVRRVYKRRREIRELVIARSNDSCEYVKCTGMPPDVGRNGRSILQVDHIQDLALGGRDVPSNMIALCPNCHSAKTHGRSAEKIAQEFKRIVENKEQKFKESTRALP